MLRVRLLLIVTIAALVAPSVALCLEAGPTGHAAMPCCRAAKGAVPVLRPCCAPADKAPATPASSSVSLPGAMPIVKAVASAPVVTPRVTHAGAYTLLPPVRSRVPSSVLLI